MWEGPMTEELEQLFFLYAEQHNGATPDEYEDIYYYDISYSEFVALIKKCLETGKEFPEVLDAEIRPSFLERVIQTPYIYRFIAAIFRKLGW